MRLCILHIELVMIMDLQIHYIVIIMLKLWVIIMIVFLTHLKMLQ